MKILATSLLLSFSQLGYSAASPQTLDIFTSRVSIDPDPQPAESLAVIPEPSTYALLVLSALAVAGYNLRNRRRNKS